MWEFPLSEKQKEIYNNILNLWNAYGSKQHLITRCIFILQAISCVSFLKSFKNMPRSEITFHQADATKRDFQCSIAIENEKEKIVVPVFFYFEKVLFWY